MAIEFKKTKHAGRVPEIWRGECKVMPGGFSVKNVLSVGDVVRRGTLLAIDYNDLKAAIVKSALVVKGGTNKSPRISKNSYIAVNDVLTKNGDGAAVVTVTAIDKSNSEYDVLTLSASYTGLTEGDVLVESEQPAKEGEKAVAKYTPNAFVASDLQVTNLGIPTIDAAYEGFLLYPSISSPVIPEWLEEGGFVLKANHNVVIYRQ